MMAWGLGLGAWGLGLGAWRKGEAGYRIADLMRDTELLEEAKENAPKLLVKYPDKARLLMQRRVHRAEDFASV